MAYAIAVVIGFVFGAVDQYLGSLWSLTHLGPWSETVSIMSAPWLALPFVFGARQARPGRAAWLGLVVTLSALAGYFALTLSPIEGVALRNVDALGFVRSQLHVIIPGLVAGPVFGWLGQRWRNSRSWLSGALVVGAFCLEPVARHAVGQPLPVPTVGTVEIVAGVLMAAYFAARRRERPPSPAHESGEIFATRQLARLQTRHRRRRERGRRMRGR